MGRVGQIIARSEGGGSLPFGAIKQASAFWYGENLSDEWPGGCKGTDS